MGIPDLSEADLVDLYGPWAPRTPADVAALLAGYPGAWWVAGGWAIEAFTGVGRAHGDIDVGVLRLELPLLRAHLAGRLHLWSASAGALRPLLPDDDPDGDADAVLLPGGRQLWARAGAGHPWELDLLLGAGSGEEWVYPRDERLRRPRREVLWERDGVRYLRPEVQLLYKARGLRDKDQADFDVAAPLLDPAARSWLRDALVRTEGGTHPWVTLL